MQKTGIIRKVDDLGRIVIPKELRKTLKIREGDNLEISLFENNKIIFEKSEPLGENLSVFKSYLECLAKNTNSTCILTDLDKVIFAFGPNSIFYINKKLKDSFVSEIVNRNLNIHQNKVVNMVEKENIKDISNEKIGILNGDGSVVGSVIMLTYNFSRKFGDLEENMLSQTIDFFVSQISI